MGASQGSGIVLDVAVFGEKQRLVTVFSRGQGKIRGLLRGVKGKPCQPLDDVAYSHYRRLDSQLGTLEIETSRSRTGWWMEGGTALLTVNWLCELLLALLPEEHVYERLYDRVEAFLNEGWGPGLWRRVVLLELLVLQESGYGLPLTEDPVVEGDGAVLAYVSPKTGRAVSVQMGEPFKDKLLGLPGFLGGLPARDDMDCVAGVRLTGWFIQQAVHGKPLKARQRLVDALMRGEL